MNTKVIISLVLLSVLLGGFYFVQQSGIKVLEPKTVTFESLDKLTITADLYMTNKSKAPYIILFHQADYSRGEYIDIAPKLNKMGFNCLAVDQRSGKRVNGVENSTARQARVQKLKTTYKEALPDMEASLNYVKNELKAEKIIIWGSSYSSALAFVLGEKYPDDVKGILAFSPGEYMKVEDRKIEDFAKNIKCPVFITSAKDETDWKSMYDKIPSDNKAYYIPDFPGKHGSSALWDNYDKSSDYWDNVKKFLDTLK
ncbi:MAG TPA: alpha/beta fold hydrolase [Clostridia bacterium]|nr:alpha/beta fold hydrolase [Clostridia bacterium]